jgi:fucose permease
VFSLTGALHVISGPLLPSLASTFHLNDSQSGLLLLLYFAGSSIGALLCTGRFARRITYGFIAAAVGCAGMTLVRGPLLLPVFLVLGVGVGSSMSAINLFVGREFPQRPAPVLVFLNFSWSTGALLAPLFAAHVLVLHDFGTAYAILGVAAALAAAVCGLFLRDGPQPVREEVERPTHSNLGVIAIFGLAVFLQVGVENSAAAWLTTYILRIAHSGVPLAARLSAIYWIGVLGSRAFAALVLLRVNPSSILRSAIPVALVAASLLVAVPTVAVCSLSMLLLGIATAPVYPLLVAASFGRVHQVADTRWVLAAAGFGGSVLPWLTGWLSAHFGSLRLGILTLPAALLTLLLLLPFLFQATPASEGPLIGSENPS